ncbi:MAG: hypothetical protein K2I70_03255, partial [Bacilli bacterium]|nr:hypothetical protein [Bacilli bacterium]
KLGLEVDAKRKDVERKYNQLSTKYKAGKIAFEDWCEIDTAYIELMDYFDKADENKEKERLLQKKILLIETEILRRSTNMGREEEKRKGPLWVLLENVDVNEIKNLNADIFSYLEEHVFSVIDPEYALVYKRFLARLKDLWDEVYLGICKFEYDLLVREDLCSSCAFSVGMDELTNSRFPKGKYKDVFDMAKELSSLIPDSEPFYFIERHFSLLAEFVGLEYSAASYGGCPIYSFNSGTRLKKYREEYLFQFGEEVRSGERKSPLVDNEELVAYVTKSLKPYNIYVRDKTS